MAVSDFLFFALSPKIHKTEPVTGEEDINNLNLISFFFVGPLSVQKVLFLLHCMKFNRNLQII
jgi:hypothetical protein